MKIFKVFYAVAGVESSDDVVAFSATQAMRILEDFLIEWGYPNNTILVDFAQDMGAV